MQKEILEKYPNSKVKVYAIWFLMIASDSCSRWKWTAGLGVLPIAIGWGAGAELQQPLAIALIGGLITSTILTLVALPALYEIAYGVQLKVNLLWSEISKRFENEPTSSPSTGD